MTFAIDCNWKIIRKCLNIIGEWNSYKRVSKRIIAYSYGICYFNDHILLYTYMERCINVYTCNCTIDWTLSRDHNSYACRAIVQLI